MLKRLAVLMALVSASTTAWADARSVCGNSKTPPDQSIATCSEVIRTDARAAWAYFNRGLAYYKKTDYDRAIADYKRSLAIREKALGPDHRDVASSLNNLAIVYRAQGRTADRRAAAQALAGDPRKGAGA